MSIKSKAGFTLIELVVVIVVLGILAIVAIPNYIDLQRQARQGATEGVAGALSSWSTMNFGACLAHNSTAKIIKNCTDLANGQAIAEPPVIEASATPKPGNFGIAPLALNTTEGKTTSCTLVNGDDPENVKVKFIVISTRQDVSTCKTTKAAPR